MENREITFALGNYIVNPLPDIKEDGENEYYPFEDLDEFIPYKFMTIDEVKKQATIDALKIFDDLYNKNNFLIQPGDSDGTAELGYFEFTNILQNAIDDLEELEDRLTALINGDDTTGVTVSDYVYTEFKKDILSD